MSRILVALASVAWLLAASHAAAADSALVRAVKSGDSGAVRALLADHTDPDAADSDGTTALHWASRGPGGEIAALLVAAGAEVSAANRYGIQPLSVAAENGNAAAVRVLLDAGASANTISTEGETALMAAARAGSLPSVTLLLDRGAPVNAKESWRGQTALMWAAAEGHVDVVRALLARDADVHVRTRTGFTAFLFAVREGRIEVATALLDAGTDVGESLMPQRTVAAGAAPPEPGQGALHLAIANGHFELAAMLLDRGADAAAAPQGWTALHQLTWVRKTGIAGSNNPPPQGSGTMTSLEFARALVARGADVNARVTKRPPVGVSRLNMIGGTPFLLAARTADAEYMRLLADLGADPRLPNEDGSSPLLVAAGLGTAAPGEDPGTEDEVLEAVKLALELGNDINARDKHGETVVHGAAYKHVPSVVRFLVDAGAQIEIWDNLNADGRSPLDIAIGIPGSMSIIRSPITEATIREVMRKAGVEPSPENR